VHPKPETQPVIASEAILDFEEIAFSPVGLDTPRERRKSFPYLTNGASLGT